MSPSPPPNTLYAQINELKTQVRKRYTEAQEPAKRFKEDTRPQIGLPQELGELIQHDVAAVRKLGWEEFVRERRKKGDLTDMSAIHHPARRILKHYAFRGVPVRLHDKGWNNQRVVEAIERVPHASAKMHSSFLWEEFIDMIKLKQWVILPLHIARNLPGLRISPPGVVPQRNRRPRWIGDYTWSEVNQQTIPLVPQESLQYGRAFDRFIRHILLADKRYGPVYLLKCDLSDGYYRLGLCIQDCPKLALSFPAAATNDPLVAIPLVLPMGWKNSV